MIMKKVVYLITVFLISTFSAVSQAQDYFVCDSGDDSNDGKSEATPFKTQAKAIKIFRGLSAGSKMQFCRGGVFEYEHTEKIFNRNCTAEKPCYLTDYGDIEKPSPIFSYKGTHAALWLNDGPNHKPDGGYVIENITLISSSFSASGILMSEDVNDVTIRNIHVENFGVGVYSAGTNDKNPLSNRKNDRIVLKDSTIINNSKSGWLGGCDDCEISNNQFINNGFHDSVRYHNIYIDNPVKTQEHGNNNIKVVNNRLYKSAIVDGKCDGVSLVVHGIISNLTIENNIIEEDKNKSTGNCWGIAIDPGNQLDESFTDVKIKGNTLINMGNVGIHCASCVRANIEENLIIDEGSTLRFGIAIPMKREDSIKSSDIVIRNNKISLNHTDGAGLWLKGENTFSAVNNTITINKNTNSRCFLLAEANQYIKTDSNICNFHSSVSILDESLDEPVKDDNIIVADKIDENISLPEEDFQRDVPLLRRSSTNLSTDSAVVINDVSSNEFSNVSTTDVSRTGSSVNINNDQNSSIVVENNSSEPQDLETINTVNSIHSVDNKSSLFDEKPLENKIINNTSNMTANYGVRLKDVHEASLQEYESIDPSSCRAYARGRCLLK